MIESAPFRDAAAHRRLTAKILRKMDLHVLPSLALIWLANFIDRTNVGNARIAGLQKDTHLEGNQFNTALAVFYASCVHTMRTSNWVLKKVGANRWLPFLVFLWGVVTTLSGLVQSFGGLVAVRVALGFCEGGILPGIVLYLSSLYGRHELQLRVGVFYASASLSGAFGGLLATAILKMDGIGNLAGWRWIFILEGIATCLIGILSAMVLPASLEKASFFDEEERKFASESARVLPRTFITQPYEHSVPVHNQAPTKSEGSEKGSDDIRREVYEPPFQVDPETEAFEWREVRRGIFEIQVWLTAISYMGIIVSLYSFSLFLPTIIAGLGFSGEKAQLHTVPPYVPATFLTVFVSYFSDRYRLRGPVILMCLPATIAGYIMLIVAKTNEVRYAAVFLVALGLYPSAPCILSILPNNSSGHYKKATTVALQLAIANGGGFLATFVYTPGEAPKYIRGHSIVLGFVSLAWVFTAMNVLYCMYENRARAAGRRQSNITEYQALWDAGKTRAPIGDRHPAFRFIL
ncbi:MFS general substrate transporter [Gloeopeniophorella convolvens]|nr:MFS general substrate transporter [Gloeopeniophorella convolvens]